MKKEEKYTRGGSWTGNKRGIEELSNDLRISNDFDRV
jgi:hypothetical protein